MDEFYTAYPLIDQLYGVEMNMTDFEEIGLIAWRHIGNEICKLYRYSAQIEDDQENFFIELPCNCDSVEAVTYDWEDWKHTSNIYENGDWNSKVTEEYIEERKLFTDPFYISGKYAKYEQVGNTLYFDRNYKHVNVLYKGYLADKEGLPCISEKEALAIATYCAMIRMRKEGFVTKNNATVQQAQLLYEEWKKLCSAARVPDKISQNEMNEILDAKNNWNRKVYSRSYKPMM